MGRGGKCSQLATTLIHKLKWLTHIIHTYVPFMHTTMSPECMELQIMFALHWQAAGQGNANAPNASVEKTLAIDGTESLMMLEFCVKHNCTLEISLGTRSSMGDAWFSALSY